MKTLTIRLTAPLQSYGNEASFERRTTGDYPAKSAIIGIIAAALGYGRDDQRIKQLNDLQFAVRIDQHGITLTDFQTVEWKKDTRKITYRDYLQDAVFVVAVGGDETTIEKIHFALKHPHYALFLGRRANVPAGVLQMDIKDGDPVSVLKQLPWRASDWYQKRQRRSATFRAEIIADADLLPDVNKSSMEVKDEAISFDSKARQYGFREVKTTVVELTNPVFKSDTEHDALSAL
ncbi:type I-E CRISPR-associated protein Cas5/CasD [Lactobacillus sp. ESL0731]|uniref:type I-E CRISPR-associated protein Cas5/CasD n=1 Tax=unclassified Lactobacillus TaxID=2620435 RepID=UPI0023FA46CB|nr:MULTISPECIES: type I-E CRISPR-associated protein Cas5/CasD [unclassified Lactobacillus]WEV51049.1 type I-E CRISPR-associated protein Cas5/CasD [Lactobacillus sp. ESL0700]WEV62179.1 type I-E CRISPR-associated protein Cas5/CasD [Lactobacillus sp. ESL0731]